MTLTFDRLRTIAPQLIAIVLMTSLALGARVQTFVSSYLLNATSAASQMPVEEEEEHRHDAKEKSGASDRRNRDRVPTPGRGDGVRLSPPLLAASHGRPSTPTRVLPDRESDYRNGIGAPLRC